MYSLLKRNNPILFKTKYILKGETFHRVLDYEHYLLCASVCHRLGRFVYFATSQNINNKSHVRLLIGFVNKIDNGNYNIEGNAFVHNILEQGGFARGAILGKQQWLHNPGKRKLHLGPRLLNDPLKPSSKVEETVVAIKEKVKEKSIASGEPPPTSPVTSQIPSSEEIPSSSSAAAPTLTSTTKQAVTASSAPPKKTLRQRIFDELAHYYHGFRLLLIDINVSRKLLWRILQGKQLTRRENKLLIRTVGDVFRMVPFSVFIIVPFMEFLLPVFIKLFPGMLPSTFQTATEKEDKMKQALKVKLEMAKFLQKTLDDMAVSGKGHSSQAAKDFAIFFEKIRTSGEMTTSEEIMKFSKLFEDEITLDSLPRPQLMALCRVLEMNPIGTTNFLRFQLRLKFRSLIADDLMIQKEGVDSLSQSELQAACRARGMRALGVSEERLKAQLSQWLDLSLIKKVPPSLLLLSQAFMLPETITTSEKLAATISALPDAVGTQTKAVIGEREGKVDHKTKIELVKEELAKINEERKEQIEEEKKEVALKEKVGKKEEELMVDQAPPLIDKAIILEPALRAVVQDIKKTSVTDRLSQDELTTKDLEALENALDALGKDQKRLLVEKEELQELRQEMAEYQEDIADLQKVSTLVGKEGEVKETRAAQLLFRRVNKMISKMDNILSHLEQKEKSIKGKEEMAPAPPSEEVLRIEDLISMIHKLQEEPDKNRLKRISEVLSKMDADRDGIVRVDSVLKVLEIIGNENVKLSKKQIDELIELIDKEEAIELDDQIIKALNKKKEDKEEKQKASRELTPSENAKQSPTHLHSSLQPPEQLSKASTKSNGSGGSKGSGVGGEDRLPSLNKEIETEKSKGMENENKKGYFKGRDEGGTDDILPFSSAIPTSSSKCPPVPGSSLGTGEGVILQEQKEKLSSPPPPPRKSSSATKPATKELG